MITTTNPNDLVGADVYGDDGKKIGTVGQVYLDPSQSPTWITIKTGLFGTSESFAPLSEASFDGGDIRLPYSKDFVKDAPNIADDGELSDTEEDSLYAYYGNGSGSTSDAGIADGTDRATYTEGYDTSGPTTDSAMTLSEEHLQVGTEKVETGRARLRKHVVTEQVSKTVPVSHEEVTISREPITEANIGAATAGPDLSEEEHEVILTGERVITNKETVPVERVSLGTETVTEQQQVSENVAHEEVEILDSDVDGDISSTSRR